MLLSTRRQPIRPRSWRSLSIEQHRASRRPHTRFLFTCGDQSGLTSAPIIPQRVQTIREHSERTGISSGSQSPLSVALWWQRPETQ